MLTLDTTIEKINKIGKAVAQKLNKLGIKNVQDLLEYYPFRYEDYSQIVKISELQAGKKVSVQGILEFIQNKRSPRKRMMITEALINDESGQLKIIWFNQPFISRTLKVGEKVSLAGLVQEDVTGPQMNGPEYERLTSGRAIHTQGLVPVYHLTANLTNKQVRFLIKSVISMAAQVPELLPNEVIKKYSLMPLNKAISIIHFPNSQAEFEQASRRLKFNELFLIQLTVQMQKAEVKRHKSDKIKFFKKETQEFVKTLPFSLTDAQKKSSWEIIRDMENNKPMSRLLEGDVGSGKTVTVALAMLNVTLNKKQSALLVPTEILASQHYDTLCKLFKDSKVRVGLFTRSSRKTNAVIAIRQLAEKQSREENDIAVETGLPRDFVDTKSLAMTKKEILNLIKSGELDIVVGTHAMIQEDVEFKNLALAIIDEQHRFGVEQRKALRKKSGNSKTIPHLLAMTATPIPRSLAQTVYGDLDLSIIDEMPKGHKTINTYLVPEKKRTDAYGFIKKEIANGQQVFVVCPLISESDKLGVKSVEVEYKKLNERIFKDLQIAYLHGKMPARGGSALGGKTPNKEETMRKFLENEINILVSTSVIEVGVDIPNATIMMIEGAERFGLAQLHQFRGRVGRSDMQSYCLLFADSLNPQTRQRLDTFAKSKDGFKLAEEDLKMRGPGEVYGTAQKGFPEMKIATLDDYVLIKEAKEAAENIMAQGISKYPELIERVKKSNEWIIG